MKRELSQKEREEPVTKGFLEGYFEYTLNKKGYVTKEFLIRNGYTTKEYYEDVFGDKKYVTKEFLESKNFVTKKHLESKNYVTKDYVYDSFDAIRKNIRSDIEEVFGKHIRAQMEYTDDKFQVLKEYFDMKLEAIQRFVKMV